MCNPTCLMVSSLGLHVEARNSLAFSIPVAPVERSCINMRVFNSDYCHILIISVLRAVVERVILDIDGHLCLTLSLIALCLDGVLADKISLCDACDPTS